MKNYVKFFLVSFMWFITGVTAVSAYFNNDGFLQGLSIVFLILTIIFTAYAIAEKR